MAIADLLAVVPAPQAPVDAGPAKRWSALKKSARIAFPDDYREFGLRYGSGYFDDPGRLLVFVSNPFGPDYLRELEQCCDELRKDRCDLRKKRRIPYGVFPHRPGWLPWGTDMDGSLLCWLTEGEPDQWPIILLSAERSSFQQLQLPMTTFLAHAFTRQIRTILWNDPAFFTGPDPIRFVPEC
jgi:hypothetical protein